MQIHRLGHEEVRALKIQKFLKSFKLRPNLFFQPEPNKHTLPSSRGTVARLFRLLSPHWMFEPQPHVTISPPVVIHAVYVQLHCALVRSFVPLMSSCQLPCLSAWYGQPNFYFLIIGLLSEEGGGGRPCKYSTYPQCDKTTIALTQMDGSTAQGQEQYHGHHKCNRNHLAQARPSPMLTMTVITTKSNKCETAHDS